MRFAAFGLKVFMQALRDYMNMTLGAKINEKGKLENVHK